LMCSKTKLLNLKITLANKEMIDYIFF